MNGSYDKCAGCAEGVIDMSMWLHMMMLIKSPAVARPCNAFYGLVVLMKYESTTPSLFTLTTSDLPCPTLNAVA